MPETTLNEKFVVLDRKMFAVALKENARGRFLRITEEKDDHHSTLIVPPEAMDDFLTVVIEMVATEKNLASIAKPAAPPADPAD